MIQEGPADRESGESPAPAASRAAPDSRRLRILELALVVGVAFLIPTVYALHDWWTGEAAPPEDGLSHFVGLVEAGLSISLLAYVLHRQGRSLRSIGLTARASDIPWALSIFFFAWLLESSVISIVANFPFPEPKEIPLAAGGWLAFLAVIPAAAEEELIVRAFLMTEVAALSGSMAVAVFASVGFQTCYHLYYGAPSALMLAGGFFVSAVFYANTRRITPVILAHALSNFWVLSRG